jgi:hypothetical protein
MWGRTRAAVVSAKGDAKKDCRRAYKRHLLEVSGVAIFGISSAASAHIQPRG